MALFRKLSQTPRKAPDVEAVESIVRNLNQILNTRRGFGSFLTDFGISDLSECSSREVLIVAIRREVELSISRYEPRIRVIAVEAKEGPDRLRLSFVITCAFRDSKRSFDLVFESRRFKVSS